MPKTILLVEDTDSQRIPITRTIEQEGHIVVAYRDGREAVDAIEDDLRYDLAIIDRELPYIDGDQVMRTSREINPSTPIICRTAYNDRVEHATKTLYKPDSLKNIIEAIQQYLDR